MIPVGEFVDALDAHGIGHHTGVPCSYLAGPIAHLSRRGRYLPAANEGAAVALAAGAWAGGTPTAVFAQNSGLGNMINPLTSLVLPYRLPLLVFLSLRGWPDPDADEPQHRVMGRATHRLLDTLGVPHWTLAGDLAAVLAPAVEAASRGGPAFVLVPKGAIGRAEPGTAPGPPRPAGLPTRAEGIAMVVDRLPGALVVATTGYTSRELFGLADCERFFYMQGSMGHAGAFGLGVVLAQGDRRHVVVLDGDGAALMHLGSMSAVGAAAPTRLVHVIFDNGVYESTGGQPTSSATTSFRQVGAAVGYRTAVECASRDEVGRALDAAAGSPGPHLVVIRVAAGAGGVPPRATSAVPAPQIHARFAAAAAAAP
ncbi:phosphonopyruvate decarboxylase [Saccharothrix syringae]|uniref:Phosphonopyruvate decarboxylase n=1 Tax=Saccharothrix syringae TaxID=103733 RepID=A0A5Q0GZZ5_SACSY|nr:phosphonopyruvate decarboxylase [Saccharothrix syringae]QFZ19546.1 phosphonopyruvate decarboxylase [Saccharothrix syringae]